MKKAKDFNADMVDLQLQVSRAYADEVGRLRLENKELRATIAAFPSTATDLQDRVTMLEGMLASLKTPNAQVQRRAACGTSAATKC